MADTSEIAGTQAGLKALDEETIEALRARVSVNWRARTLDCKKNCKNLSTN